MKLSEVPFAIEWLGQFEPRAVHQARLSIDTLKLVSFLDFERAIWRLVNTVLERTTGVVALFAVDKSVIDAATIPGSEGRISHALVNIRRRMPERLRVRPSQDEMLAEKVDEIVLVDDLVGSGQRILSFWKYWSTKTLKSWLSYRKCRIWLASYAMYQHSIETISKQISYLAPDNILSELKLVDEAAHWPSVLATFFESAAENTEFPQYPGGFGNLYCPLVFQHGCPDNCPAFLWSGGPSYNALFPGRSVPPELYGAFTSEHEHSRAPELLWKSGQNQLALSIIDRFFNLNKDPIYIHMMTVLGVLAKGVASNRVSSVLLVEQSKIDELLEGAKSLGLLDKMCNVTPFGKDILLRARRTFFKSKTRVSNSGPYFPVQFQHKICGAQPNSSNEPV